MADYNQILTFLKGIIHLVRLYGVGMVVFGRSFAIPLFNLLRFGPSKIADGGQIDDRFMYYTVFCFGVLGAVIVGWMTLLVQIAEFADPSLDPPIRAKTREILAWSTSVWFVFDTGFSIVTQEYEHAAFNVPFFALLMVPLWLLHKKDAMNEERAVPIDYGST